MLSEPIAIIGRSCVLPGALSVEELWGAVLRGADLLGPCPPGYWRMASRRGGPNGGDAATWSDRGGRVVGFEQVFDPTGFVIAAEDLLALDPLFHWVVHSARQALRDAGENELAAAQGISPAARTGVILGNLAYPTQAFARFSESVWLDRLGPQVARGRAGAVAGAQRPDARNRFASGLVAPMVARALRLGGAAFALDAACASSLYAIRLGCDWIAAGRADLMLVGAANRADNLMIHGGFAALQALSGSGQSRPFHREADGLVPAEGAGFVVLKRLADAVRDGNRIFGVIRAVGLSNDGKGRGLLVPSEEGQERAIVDAYRRSGLTPSDISLVECHATGTLVGDATEVRSMARVYDDRRDVPIGSLKSNLGHLITASGIAALLKVLSAMEHGIRPPTLHADAPIDELRRSPFRLLRDPEPWPSRGPRRAAINNFGFGGNNAHLLVEEWDGGPAPKRKRRRTVTDAIAITAIEVLAADGRGLADFRRDLFSGRSRVRRQDDQGEGAFAATIDLPLTGLRFPPSDLEQTLPQQLLILKAACQLLAGRALGPRERTALWIGMECDAEVPRYGLRLRVPDWAPLWADTADCVVTPEWLATASAATYAPHGPAGVVGSMPNILANRLASQFDIAGQAFTVAAGEASGLVALDLAIQGLQRRDCDVAIAGAVDICCEPVHRTAAAALWSDGRQIPGDSAVVLLLQRVSDARRNGARVLAIVGEEQDDEPSFKVDLESLRQRFGHPHAAEGLLAVAAGALACSHRATPPTRPGIPSLPWLRPKPVDVTVESPSASSAYRVRLQSGDRPEPLATTDAVRLRVYAGATRRDLMLGIANGITGGEGPCRLAVIGASDSQLEDRLRHATTMLAHPDIGSGEVAPGVYFRERPIDGEVSVVFTGPAGAYHGMASELALAFPEIVEQLVQRSELPVEAGWIYEPSPAEQPIEPSSKLWAASLVSQLHYRLLCDVAEVRAHAVLGFSAGESNALLATGAWTDAGALCRELSSAGIFAQQLGGQFAVIRRAWGDPAARWTNYRVFAREDAILAALAGEKHAHLTIVNAPGDAVIGGDARACRRVLERLAPARATALGYDLAIHCAEIDGYRDEYRRLHYRDTRPVPGMRFYSAFLGSSYELSADAVADALTGLATSRLDFPRVIDAAWRDGVRVFVEVGPGDACAKWVREVLEGRDHLAVAMDRQGCNSAQQLLETTAQLHVAGLTVNLAAVLRRLREAQGPATASGTANTRVYPAHPPAVVFPPMPPRADVPAGIRTVEAAASLAQHDAALTEVTAPAVAIAAAHYTRVIGAHREYVDLMGQAHRQFIGVQERRLAQIHLVARAMPDQTSRTREPAIPASAARMQTAAFPGPSFDRPQLEQLASGTISTILGSSFVGQDQYERQVRLPEPPLLLVDRVLGIAGEPGSMKLGTIWTETDVGADAWYLNDEGRMPASIVVESGQADLLLISWLGVDRLNRGERVYRLLGCELRFTGELPKAGDRLQYEIHVDGHAVAGNVRLFFFHYDCRVNGELRLSVRHAQAGFFTEQELRSSGGLLWDAASVAVRPDARVDPPHVVTTRRRFERSEVRAFSEGRGHECFGPGFERIAIHTRTPKIQSGRMLLLGEVTHFEPAGGPWKRGYLRVSSRVHPDDWYFRGHFKNDPCMPGTLMCEGCLQAMSFFLTGLGYTLERDGWRFEPVPDETYRLRCRGQVGRDSRELVYEVFVEEIHDGPSPRIIADVLGTVDGLKVFHGRRLGTQLVPDWPLGSLPHLRDGAEESRADVAIVNGFRFGLGSLLACAWGRPSDAFGEAARVFDRHGRIPRLPAPPYHFMSRVCRVDATMGDLTRGAAAEVEYDIPSDAWYLDENCQETMPFCVLLEAALQPCGWLAVYVGMLLAAEHDLVFRNLNGTAELLTELRPDVGTLRTRVVLTSVARVGQTTLLEFEVESQMAGTRVQRMTAKCGFFPRTALTQPAGLPATPEDLETLHAASDVLVDLRSRPDRYFAGPLRLPGPMLLAIDRITGYWPQGGPAHLGRARAETALDVRDWFFKSHFFQDPVQPGSLGLEAMLQSLQFCMLYEGMDRDFAQPRFEPLALHTPMTWTLRGQITPEHSRVVVEMNILAKRRDEYGAVAVAEAWIWADDRRIYHARGIGMRIIDSLTPLRLAATTTTDEFVDTEQPPLGVRSVDADGLRPMPLADRMARTALDYVCATYTARAHEWRVVEIGGVQLTRLLPSDTLLRLRTDVLPLDSRADFSCVSRVVLQVTVSGSCSDARAGELPFPAVASSRVTVARRFPPRPPAWLARLDDERGRGEGSATLDASLAGVTRGLLHPELLERALEAVSRPAGPPARVLSAVFYQPPPLGGDIRCEAHLDGFEGDPCRPLRIQLVEGDGVWAEMCIVDATAV